MSRATKVAILVILVLIFDQSLKIWVKTSMEYGDDIKMFGLNWARLHFVENPGMAFGMELAGEYGKLILSLFRIFAVGFLIYLIRGLIHSNASNGLLLSFGLVLAGALGNIIDSTFYGVLFNESKVHGGLAMMFPPDGGYAPLLHGKVVDMFYFPMFRGYFPEWFPFWAGEPYTFFKPVFNIADSAISVGVFSLILFHRNFFGAPEKKDAVQDNVVESEAENSAAVEEDNLENETQVNPESPTQDS